MTTEQPLLGLLPKMPITTFEGWRQHVARTQEARPQVPSKNEWQRMPNEEKTRAKRERLVWIAELTPIPTVETDKFMAEVIETASTNYRAAPGARPGFVLEGLATLGKSTTFQELGRKYELDLRKTFGLGLSEDAGLNIFLPVAYVTLPGLVTIKTFNHELVRFYGVPISKNANEQESTDAVVSAANGCATTLILVDDIHFLKLRNRSAQAVNDHLKSLASRISATFGYAGVALDESGLFLEGRSEESRTKSQTTHRFSRYTLFPFELGSEECREFLLKFEAQLCLINQAPGSILKLDKYIHSRTRGFKGAIAQLLKLGARKAIREGKECLSIEILDQIRLDDASESTRTPKTRHG